MCVGYNGIIPGLELGIKVGLGLRLGLGYVRRV